MDVSFSLEENHFACASLAISAVTNSPTMFFNSSEDVSGISRLKDDPERSTNCGSDAKIKCVRIAILYTDVRASHIGEENSILRRIMSFALGVKSRWRKTPFFKRFFVI